MSDKPNIVGPEYLADLLQKTVKTIKTDVTRRPESLPPRLAIPGSARLMWVESDVIDWLNSFRPAAKKKPGRPSQVSQQSQPGQTLDFSRLIGAWEAISDDRLAQYQAALPAEWNGASDMIGKVLGFVRQLRDNIRPAMMEMQKVLI